VTKAKAKHCNTEIIDHGNSTYGVRGNWTTAGPTIQGAGGSFQRGGALRPAVGPVAGCNPRTSIPYMNSGADRNNSRQKELFTA
jgi:hypothetical protein